MQNLAPIRPFVLPVLILLSASVVAGGLFLFSQKAHAVLVTQGTTEQGYRCTGTPTGYAFSESIDAPYPYDYAPVDNAYPVPEPPDLWDDPSRYCLETRTQDYSPSGTSQTNITFHRVIITWYLGNGTAPATQPNSVSRISNGTLNHAGRTSAAQVITGQQECTYVPGACTMTNPPDVVSARNFVYEGTQTTAYYGSYSECFAAGFAECNEQRSTIFDSNGESTDTYRVYGVSNPQGLRERALETTYRPDGTIQREIQWTAHRYQLTPAYSVCERGTYEDCTNVDEAPEAILTATPSTVTTGGSSALAYSCTDSNSATISSIGAVTPVSNGTRTVTPGTTTTYTLTCTGAGGTDTAEATVTVSPPVTAALLPDLTASGVAPTGATAGTPVQLSATVTNQGGAAATTTFPNFFEIDPGGTHIFLTANTVPANFTQGAAAAIAGTRTFASAGAYQVRACADAASGWASAIYEGAPGSAAEMNNCGAWTPFTVCTAGQTWNGSACVGGTAPTCSFSASPNPITLGQSSTLTWSSSNATSCTGTGFSTGSGNPTSGTRSVTPTSLPASYSISCSGATGPACVRNVTITESGACTGTPSVDITATPNRVRANPNGTPFTLSWSGTNVAGTCTIRGTDGFSQDVTASSCTLPGGTSTGRTITTQTTYTITCGSATDSVTVNVIPKFDEF